MTPQRKPDYVFNVWGDGAVTRHDPESPFSASDLLALNKRANVSLDHRLRLSARIRVHMKPAKHKTQGQMLADFSEAVIAKRQAESLALPPSPEGFFPYCFETGGPVYNIPQGFIPHDGGPCPVADGTKGAILCRGNEKPYLYTPSSLDSVQWMHCSKPNDIIAYRIERSPDFNVEAGKFYITASGERVGPMLCEPDYCQVRRNHKGFWNLRGDALVKDAGWATDILAIAADQTSPMVSGPMVSA